MSVINQMLKDLDQRQADQGGTSHFTVPVDSPSSNKKIIFISLIVIVLLNTGGIFIWQMYVENQALKVSKALEINHSQKPVLKNSKLDNSAHVVKNESTNQANNSNITTGLLKTQQNKADIAQIIPPINKLTQDNISKIEVPLATMSTATSSSNNLQAPVTLTSLPVTKSTLKISRKELSPDALAKQKLIRAEQALANKDIAKAESLFEDVLLVIPEHKSARKQLAALWFGRQAYSDALNLLSQGINLSPNDSEFRLMKARIYLKKNRIRQAFTTLNNIPNVNDVINVEYQSLRATMAQQLNEFSFSAEAYQILVSIEPSSSRWWLGLGVALDSNSEFEQASFAYKTALNKNGLSGSAENFARQRITELGE
ncbi:lipopolysaccharide assembly protein LapB [Colwellia sp. MB02u-14]|uniref:tetratricopeptide repeat protein n=1 Tax=Colwellia sp. MB02u-14 TaxID=2759815 RepID=UPI0015F3C97D|nr:tetratricopeptide repeat protein [Colwellia sp. MB02u-14]MBA6304733.1 tetratricopeptide repeat protein [Colwellia sp. MB02u-14]